MATKEIPILTQTFKANQDDTTAAKRLIWSATVANGHEAAGKGRVVSISANGEVKLADGNESITGTLVAVFQNKTCTVLTIGGEVLMLQATASGVTLGSSVVGAAATVGGNTVYGYVARRV